MKGSEGQVDIYVSLDELFDTRWGTLNLMGGEAAEWALTHDYQTRLSDDFPGIKKDEFKERYAKRNVETLAATMMTSMYKMLNRLADTVAEQMATRPYYKGCKIVVNCYPYQLSPEVEEEIWKVVRIRTLDQLPVKLVNYPISELTPSRCKKEFGVLIMYNPQEWFNTHMPALERNPMPEVIMLSPKIHHILNPNEEQMQQLLDQGAAPFLAFEMLARPLVSLDLIEVAYFNIVDPDSI
jgi:hypothetical protein